MSDYWPSLEARDYQTPQPVPRDDPRWVASLEPCPGRRSGKHTWFPEPSGRGIGFDTECKRCEAIRNRYPEF